MLILIHPLRWVHGICRINNMDGMETMDPGMASLMGSPQDVQDHPVDNLAARGGMPLAQSGTTPLSNEELAEGMQSGHTGDVAKKLGSKYKVSKSKKKR